MKTRVVKPAACPFCGCTETFVATKGGFGATTMVRCRNARHLPKRAEPGISADTGLDSDGKPWGCGAEGPHVGSDEYMELGTAAHDAAAQEAIRRWNSVASLESWISRSH